MNRSSQINNIHIVGSTVKSNKTQQVNTKKSSSSVKTSPPNSSAQSNVGSYQQSFSSQLFNEVISTSNGENIVISPFSIYVALLLASAGASGETLRELIQALCGSDYPESFNETWKREILSQMQQLALPKNVSMANNLFVEQSYELKEEYSEFMQQAFGTKVQQCDFINNPEKERLKMNEWIEKQTNQKITNLIPPGSFNTLVRVVLINAVHFLGKWAKEFSKKETYKGLFRNSDSTTSSVSMMNKSDSTEMFGTIDSFKYVRLPYSNPKLKMTIIINSQNNNSVDSWICKRLEMKTPFPVQETKLRSLTIPKFDIEFPLNLNSILKESPFNMVDSFDNTKADFSLMSEKEEIYISDIFHKAKIHVDEQGTEASAATAIVKKTLSFDRNKVDFIVDSPFAFVITFEQNILFIGKVNKL